MFKNALKKILLQMMPGPASTMQILWHRRHVRRLEKRLGLPHIHKSLVSRYGQRVLQGPFEGMAYVSCAVGSAFLPKLVGSYEAELHDIIDDVVATKYGMVIDVGCAEGYYAVGLARRMPSTHIYAFDVDRLARKLCRMMALANCVKDRVTIRSKCDPSELETLLKGNALIICDCEGYEIELLRPDLAPSLRTADVLVELQDRVKPGLTPTILERFRSTHNISLVNTAERRGSEYPQLQFLRPEEQELAVTELRHGDQQWAFMKAYNSNSNVIEGS